MSATFRFQLLDTSGDGGLSRKELALGLFRKSSLPCSPAAGVFLLLVIFPLVHTKDLRRPVMNYGARAYAQELEYGSHLSKLRCF